MPVLPDAIQLIETQVAVKRARCVIVDDGGPIESSLFGTRDGYLNLALALLRFVADVDAGNCWSTEECCHWDDRIKDAMYQLPTYIAWLVGSFLFKDHAGYLARLNEAVSPQIGCPLLNDPQFRDP